MNKRISLSTALMSMVFISCTHTGQLIGPAEALAHGSRTYSQTPNVLLKAAESAARELDYGIKTVDPEKGRIVTRLRRHRPPGANPMALRLPAEKRQYVIHIEAKAGSTRVVALPRRYIDTNDVSHYDNWDLALEQQAWAELFSTIDKQLPSI